MKDSAYKISLDIHEHASQAVLKAKKTDTGRKLHITLRAGGTPYTIEDDCYAAFKATKPDGTILFNACTIENNEIIYEFTEQTCTAVGRLRCEIALYGPDDKIITSPRFSLLVDGTIYPDEIVESADEFSALTELIADTLEATDAATQAAQNAVAAAGNADQSAENANQATMSANQSANAAIQAAQNAITASENANGAAGRANEATNAANDATSNANNAANNANETATNLVRIVKNAMAVGQVEGVSISLDDAVELGFVGCRLFGKTTQDRTPTPDAPVELVSVGAGGSVTVSVTGDNKLQNMIVATPNGLSGIPVDSGGNYTDANGQQWICDEIDLARGVYVQGIYKIALDTIASWRKTESDEVFQVTTALTHESQWIAGLCTHFKVKTVYSKTDKPYMRLADNGKQIYFEDNVGNYTSSEEWAAFLVAEAENGTPVELLYVLATPIEIPLSEEELAAYKALYTYKEHTTVSNDGHAYMELEYVLDAKKYIDSLMAGAIPPTTGTILPATVE